MIVFTLGCAALASACMVVARLAVVEARRAAHRALVAAEAAKQRADRAEIASAAAWKAVNEAMRQAVRIEGDRLHNVRSVREEDLMSSFRGDLLASSWTMPRSARYNVSTRSEYPHD